MHTYSDYCYLFSTISYSSIFQGIQTIPLDSVQTALKKYNESMRKYYMLSYMPNGNANSEPMGFYLRLFLSSSHNSTTLVSKKTAMTFFSLTGCEFLSHALNSGDSLDSKCHGVRSLCDLINRLATGPPGRREVPIYGMSTMTRLLYDELGGNCCTRVFLNLPEVPNPTVHSMLLHLASQLSRIRNAPILNDEAAMLLASRSREQIHHAEQLVLRRRLQSNDGGTDNNCHDDSDETFIFGGSHSLRNHVNELNNRIVRLNEECAHATEERIKFSKLWLTSEEEKSAIAEKLATCEVERQELVLKNQELRAITEKSLEASKQAIELKQANDMLNKYCTELHNQLDKLQNDLEFSAAQNEELSRELLHQLTQQKLLLSQTIDQNTTTNLIPEVDHELNRVQAMIGSTRDRLWPSSSQKNLQKQNRKIIVKETKSTAEKQPDLLERSKRNRQSLHLSREREHKQMERIQASEAQSHLVDAVKSTDTVVAKEAAHSLRRYLRHLLGDINSAHKLRESQLLYIVRHLDTECQVTREAMKEIMQAYVHLRTQAMEEAGKISDPGPPPLELVDRATKSVKQKGYQLNLSASVLAASTDQLKYRDLGGKDDFGLRLDGSYTDLKARKPENVKRK
ncbi:Uveal autoantigen with coiled-coil domains and ankyrin repeats protein [Paragonimus heterotremus]|uniref:Uveal autoantigen with coiled-coil domains and ankyrin repeats protein n=1 Tax=Paragonimus heterotremus TaxID=100268 RepID=A0A8J4TEX6_9TREM|nr:Uveal autoantigen with coiled-coil domains and ankyrin repeats protein [Paragonimus heterotremus]